MVWWCCCYLRMNRRNTISEGERLAFLSPWWSGGMCSTPQWTLCRENSFLGEGPHTAVILVFGLTPYARNTVRPSRSNRSKQGKPKRPAILALMVSAADRVCTVPVPRWSPFLFVSYSRAVDLTVTTLLCVQVVQPPRDHHPREQRVWPAPVPREANPKVC